MQSPFGNTESVKMTEADFLKISQFIYSQYGIKMPLNKKTLLESRLQKRLKTTQIASFKAYIDYLFTPHGQSVELVPMVDEVTTNKTDFFRGPDHFEFLSNVVAPELMRNKVNAFKIWSAGCSTGEEPYTIAMVMNEYGLQHPQVNYSVLGTDLSTQVLQRSVNAVYTEEQIAEVPLDLKRKYFLQSRNRQEHRVRVVQALRDRIVFQRLNLMEEQYKTLTNFQVIFCRNVLIYFDRPTQESVICKLASRLVKGGYLFIGHSESLTQMKVPLQQVKPTIFRKV
jgi:chemotaxis protein methyltransferase CheR